MGCKKYWRIIRVILIAGVFAVICFVCVIVGIDSYQYHRNKEIIKSFQENEEPSSTLVVFYSRSGNTELMARKIAEVKKAHVLPIKTTRDDVGFWGWLQALNDARKTEAEITPDKIDLTKYDTIYIGSPIWLYSPAPPVFEFVGNNDFSEKKVVLFNSMNSKFEQEYIDRFKNIVVQNGGEFLKHIYIIRGRMTQQMEVSTFLNEVEQELIN
ncbi:hypothetical protein NO995_07010 [Aestuariibaculum sp. M13]|uniref:flavodoxin family protein n=1 Tax=Aestuariibaculum sp. M13 TaxID=2967132 RepID=UPI002159FE31|nr:hypothetical protein [Aestuariibaculum sp. M13]MCR8667423.1 hypothetical protein [Aestuariibaculum sp. M13]